MGEQGAKLSGGQLQRLAIARAFYSRKKIIFLDEATNALDINMENKLIDFLCTNLKDITLIMISHRPDAVSKCDQIIEIKNGHIKNI